MSAFNNKRLGVPIQLSTSPAVFYTVPANVTDTIVTVMTFANAASGSVLISGHFVPNGGTADNTNIVIPNAVLEGNHVANFNFGQSIHPGSAIVVYASASGSVAFHCSGIEVV